MNQFRSKQSGFTLLEMIVVLVIIGLLMGLVGPRLFSQADRAKTQTADTQIRMLRGALETMRLDIGRYPTAEEGLRLLIEPPSSGTGAARWRGPYVDDALPNDPWDRPYMYELKASGASRFSLYSRGEDGQPGGEDTNADVGYLPES